MGDSISHERQPPAGELGGAKWEIGFYEDILKRNPDYVEVLMLLGNLYTGHKLYAKGLEVDRRLASLKKDDPIVYYNLACSHSLLKQADEAFGALFKAVDLGYRDIDHVQQDGDLDAVRADPRYEEALGRMRRSGRRPGRRPRPES